LGDLFLLIDEARTGHERSEKNSPVDCFGARVRAAARQCRRASLVARSRKKKDTLSRVFLFSTK